jgi:hypothetical protein
MGAVINRLSLLTEPNRIKRLSRVIDLHKNKWLQNRDTAESAFSALQAQLREQQSKGKVDLVTTESYQAALAGFLFAENRKSFGDEALCATGYDSEKEGRQIEAVAHALNKQHLHMGTGEGKSSVVIPISSLVEAASNGTGRVVVGSANGLLAEELRRNIEVYSEKMSTLACNKDAKIAVHRITQDHEKQGGEIAHELTKDAIHQAKDTSAIKLRQNDAFWTKIVEGVNNPPAERYCDREKNINSGDISVFVGEESTIVFDWMEDRKKFEANCPTIFMDEAHVPFDKGTPYAKTSGTEALSDSIIRSGISEYLVNYIVAQRLQAGVKGGLIESSQGGYQLTERGRKRVVATDIAHIRLNGDDQDSRAFQRGVAIVLESMGVDNTAGSGQVISNLLADLKQFIPRAKKPSYVDKAIANQPDYFEAVGNEVAKMLPNKEKMFTANRKGKLQLRDAYIDQLLSDNKYNPTAQTAVLAISGTFEPIERSISYKNSSYASFVTGVKNKLVALSGTLMTPDPLKKRMRRGAFAAFLEDTTKRKVCMLAAPEIKTFPRPQLLDTQSKLYEKMFFDLESTPPRPTLIIDNGSLNSVQYTYEQMKSRFGEARVRLLLAKPAESDAEESAAYEKSLDMYRKQLAEGQIDFLISSGSAALGTNFVKKDATFPDIRTITIGMPESEEKMAQTIGRRRLPEGDTQNHFWYLAQADLEQYLTYFKESDTMRFYEFLQKGKEEMKGDIKKAQDKPEDLFKLMVELWDKARTARAVDTEYAVGFDALMDTEVVPTIERYMKTKIAREILGYGEQELQYIYDEYAIQQNNSEYNIPPQVRKRKELIDFIYRQFGAPSTLYSDIQQKYMLVPNMPKSGAQVAAQSVVTKLADIKKFIFSNPEANPDEGMVFGFNSYLDTWFEMGREGVEEYIDTINTKDNIDFMLPEANTARAFAFFSHQGLPDDYKILELVKTYQPVEMYEHTYSTNLVRCVRGDKTILVPILFDPQTRTSAVGFDVVNDTYLIFPEELTERVTDMQIQVPSIPITYPVSNGSGGTVRIPLSLVKVKYKEPDKSKV